MKLFKSKLLNRIALWKLLGFIFWLWAFFIMPIFFTEATSMLSWAILLWYITMWSFIWLIGVFTEHPLCKKKIPSWIRWLYIWAWMNFVLALFMFDSLSLLMIDTAFEWLSPFRIIIEWWFFWMITDIIITKNIWEWKKLLK